MEKLIVTNKYDKKMLDKFVLDNLPYLSKNNFYKLLRKRDIKVNGKRVNSNVEIHLHDEVMVYTPRCLSENYNKLDIVYEDGNIIIVNKTAGIEVTGKNSLTEIVHNKYENSEFKPMPCHRLDRNTTGLVIFAKTEEALHILEQKFKNHEIKKYYKALVYGVPKQKEARLEAYLFKDSKKSIVYISNIPKKGYKKIVTNYKLIEKYKNNTSLLEVQIETGRTHQIRAHLAHIGLPIVGDGKYGINQVNKELGRKTQSLCAYKLKFSFKEEAGSLEYLNEKEFAI